MDKGQDFLKRQINNAVLQHRTFIEALEDHEKQAEDLRFRNLCARHLGPMKEHQQMLEDYERDIDASPGMTKKAVGAVFGVVRDLADSARQDDFLRLVGDIVLARQSEDTFKTFREAGKILGDQKLSQIGEIAERHHDIYVKEANHLIQQMFVEHVRAGDNMDTTSRASRTEQSATPSPIAEEGF